jgi:fructose-1,6-bisphosphatase/inositol monophosphatase family enzyme
VDRVIPAVVAHDGKDTVGVNYDSLVGVLVEAVKEQEGLIKQQEVKYQTELKAQEARHQAELKEQQKSISALSAKVSELERLLILSNAVSKAD